MSIKVAIMRKYSIAEISKKTGLSRRTIRYYLQRGLVPSPLGAGRGRYYTQDHLDRIRAIIDLQAKGMFLDEIARHLAADGALEPDLHEEPTVLEKREGFPRASLDVLEVDRPDADYELAETVTAGQESVFRETWVRVPLADGVELNVREDLSILVDEHLQQITDTIGRIITGSRISKHNMKKEKGDKDEK
jgi:DNA-binding transcriptional MerR regulator